MTENKVNLSIQIIPKSPEGNTYELVDKAIDEIKKSGVEYRVCPFETVMEGTYNELISVAGKAQEACFNAGAEEVLVFIKIQRRKNIDVTIDEKMKLYD